MRTERIIQQHLDQASKQWKWLRFLRHSATLGIIVTFVLFAARSGRRLRLAHERGRRYSVPGAPCGRSGPGAGIVGSGRCHI
jgi:hypothetical protein